MTERTDIDQALVHVAEHLQRINQRRDDAEKLWNSFAALQDTVQGAFFELIPVDEIVGDTRSGIFAMAHADVSKVRPGIYPGILEQCPSPADIRGRASAARSRLFLSHDHVFGGFPVEFPAGPGDHSGC